MIDFIKKHLYLCGLICFGLFVGSLMLTLLLGITNKIIIALCFIPIPIALILFFLSNLKDAEKAQAEKAAAEERRDAAQRAAGVSRLDAMSRYRYEQMMRTQQSDEAQSTMPDNVAMDSILHIDGWNVYTNPEPLIRYPVLFRKPKEKTAVLPITEPAPELTLYSGEKEVFRYKIDGEPGEDFTGKYFHMSARIYMQGVPAAPAVLMDGFISDDDDPEQKITISLTGYRMEVFFVGGEIADQRNEELRGKDVDAKALRFPGIITPGNIRYLGVCRDCMRSFMFHSYNFPHMSEIPAYSDDGLDVCGVPAQLPDADTWEGTINGVHFSTHNAFCCPYCGAPYADYKAHPEMMRYGTYACAHAGRKITAFQPDETE